MKLISYRQAGWAYLFLILFGTFAELWVRSTIRIEGNAPATLQQVESHIGLMRWGFMADMMMITAFFILGLLLFQLLKKVHAFQARLMWYSILISVVILAVNMINHLIPVILVSNKQYLLDLGLKQLEFMVAWHLELHKQMYRIAQVFFGIWLFPFGFLLGKTGEYPSVMAWMLKLACFCYLIDFFLFFLWPGYSDNLSSWITFPTVIAEFYACFWLLKQRPNRVLNTSRRSVLS